MATSSSAISKSNNFYHVRSISFPPRSHPNILKIVKGIDKLSNATSILSSRSVCTALLGLDDIYASLEDLLNLRSTQQVLSCNQQEKFLNKLLDGSVRLLDVFSSIREILSQIKEKVQVLRSALRRRKSKGDPSIEAGVADYASLRKKMRKDAKKLVAALKKMELKSQDSPVNVDLADQHLASVTRVLREVNLLTSSTFQSVLSFLSLPASRPNKRSGWALVLRMIPKGAIAPCEVDDQEEASEMDSIDTTLSTLCKQMSSEGVDVEKLQHTQHQLEALEMSIEGLEDALECLYRHLIRTRASLLNIFSQ